MFKSAKFAFLLICVLCAVERSSSFGFTARTNQLKSMRNAVNRGQRNGMSMRVQSARPFASNDWLDNIKNLPASKINKDITSHLWFNTGWAVLITCIHMFTPQHYIDDFHISTVPQTLMASALSLLLIFRNNAAYDRFWESRKVWGAITNTVRNLARLGKITIDDEEVLSLYKDYLRSYPFLLKQHLQNTRNDEELDWLKARLPKYEFENIQSNPNPPLLVLQRMSQILGTLFPPSSKPSQAKVFYRIKIEECINLLSDCVGLCERILNTPVPRSYSRHTSRLLTVFLLTLPIVLVPHTEFGTPLVVLLMGWGMLSIEGIAYLIEQPFDATNNQLPMINYCNNLFRNVDFIVSEKSYGRLVDTSILKKYETYHVNGGYGGGPRIEAVPKDSSKVQSS
uniref:Uncharacterized protein n=1 Tax=Vaucheria litorea TaxID=109269 RepID=H6WBA7_VAULI|nr:hypothetical protein [Vaucheria litorea]|mmetsp:Transcript_8388/g.11788  ORF Transcript_8388/g.11788 Transcript_8388/m.11788 type:complete len:397 (+) Transcript_8388:28-1218(+)